MTPPDSATNAAPVSPPIRLDAGETLTIYTVEALAATWKTALAQPGDTTVELSRITRCDSLGIQLLCSTRRTVEAAGARVTWSNPTAAVLGAAAAIGCEALFNRNPRET